ncbi:DNA ligase [Geodia barretti]|uniref:DNA ligase n=1 Tax=Geodia barretti TaxID=519541 RepID=A0AA35XEE2_GEOBA|nr:DNA ligase [Geodia barretti]
MDIEGMGIKWGEFLIQQGLIKDVADLYYLEPEHLARLNLLDAIEAAKARSFADALAAAGIPTVGKKSASIIAERFGNMSALSSASELNVGELSGVSARTASAIFAHFSELRMQPHFTRLGSDFLGNGLIDVQSDLFYVNRKHLLQPEMLRQKSVSTCCLPLKPASSAHCRVFWLRSAYGMSAARLPSCSPAHLRLSTT